jgi:NAD(P)-dependent dehydrogenase (short-subunit alcohol dehydrogenase family)
MSDKGQKVAIITGGSQGIGASLVTAYRPVQVGSSAAARLSDSHRLKSAVLQLR